jgi:hypothetical protein
MVILPLEQAIEISGVEAPCLQCGRPIVVTVPRWLVSTGAPQGKRPKTLPGRLKLWPEFGDPGLCLGCRLAALPTSTADVKGEYQAVLDDAADAGIPDGAVIWPITFAAGEEAPMQWRGWRGRMLGIQVTGLPARFGDAPGLNAWRFALDDGRLPIEIIVYETVLARSDIPTASLRFHSPPGVWPARLELRGWNRVGRALAGTHAGYRPVSRDD